MKRITNVLFLSALISSCATPPPNLIWEKPKAAMHDFTNDKYKCLQDAASKAPTVAGSYGEFSSNEYGASGFLASGNMNAGLRQQLFVSCMQAKGWHILNATQMGKELNEADKICHASDADDKDKAVAFSNCVGHMERQIWKKDEPNTLDLYDEFRVNIGNIVTQFQNGDISHEDYISAINGANMTFKTKLSARRSLVAD